MPEFNSLKIAAAALAFGLISLPAQAGLTIAPNNGNTDTIDDNGGTTGTGVPTGQPANGNGLTMGLQGYNSQVSPTTAPVLLPTLSADAGSYLLTYMGSGNAADTDTFSIGNCVFTNNAGGGGYHAWIHLPSFVGRRHPQFHLR
jgi:hypothetical protein